MTGEEALVFSFALGGATMSVGVIIGAVVCWLTIRAHYRQHGLIVIPKAALGVEE